ncbi:DUF2505 domain-containing protein [Nocardioides daejeonensis]|uniref:DUF2505 domain-containing protein n=1 Tax=Nocardioides daejeonensis TaxID=1046556 RepID=UPI000D74E4D6|nr:DUF2505 domain-containing protein [Nocardioides daejeonensis]
MSRVTHDLVYDGATVDQVVAMLMTPAFREAVCDAQTHMLGREVTIDGNRVTVDQRQDADNIPSFAKKFVGAELRIVQAEEWTTPTHGDIHVTIPGKPGDIRGTADVRQDGDRVVETVVLDVEVKIPLVGGKIAGLIGDKLKRTLEVEERTGRTWLAERR